MNTIKYLFLFSLATLASANLKKVEDHGTYPEWKRVAEKAKALVASKYKNLEESAEKMSKDDSAALKKEIAKLDDPKKHVEEEAEKILKMEKDEYLKDEKPETKLEAAKKAYGAAEELYKKLAVYETTQKAAELERAKLVSKTTGGKALLTFLKGKIASFERDAFVLAAFIAAIAAPAVAATAGPLFY